MSLAIVGRIRQMILLCILTVLVNCNSDCIDQLHSDCIDQLMSGNTDAENYLPTDVLKRLWHRSSPVEAELPS